jgi:hypothetical protein
MTRSRHPTAESILEAAAKFGLAVRIDYREGKIASVVTLGKVCESSEPATDALNNGAAELTQWIEKHARGNQGH